MAQTLSTGTRSRLARLGKGWTLKDLAKETSYSESHLSLVERDMREVPEIVAEILELNGDIWYEELLEKLATIVPIDSGLVDSLNRALKV